MTVSTKSTTDSRCTQAPPGPPGDFSCNSNSALQLTGTSYAGFHNEDGAVRKRFSTAWGVVMEQAPADSCRRNSSLI